MAFHVIAVAEGLAEADRSRAVEVGPPAVTAEAEYSTLLTAAGFDRIRIRDDSASYRETAAAWLREWARDAHELEPLFGAQEFSDRQARRRNALKAVDSLRTALEAAASKEGKNEPGMYF